LSVLEAQASKVPILAAPTAGMPEVVRDGETGFLIAADDAARYADRLQILLARPELARPADPPWCRDEDGCDEPHRTFTRQPLNSLEQHP
jgi:glycosyltransferase involved in cell wall biosynthesis